MRLALLSLFSIVSITLFGQQVRYDAQLSYCQIEISPEIIFAFMPDNETEKAKQIKKDYERPSDLIAFAEYNEYEAYLHDVLYKEIVQALKERFGLTISSKVKVDKSTDSTVYGFPVANKSVFKKNDGFYFVKLQIKINSLENINMAEGQPADQSTVTPVIQMSLILYDKEGKKEKKAVGKYQSPHFVDGQLQDFMLWDERSRLRGFKANESIRDTYLSGLLKRGMGKLQESYYK